MAQALKQVTPTSRMQLRFALWRLSSLSLRHCASMPLVTSTPRSIAVPELTALIGQKVPRLPDHPAAVMASKDTIFKVKRPGIPSGVDAANRLSPSKSIT